MQQLIAQLGAVLSVLFAAFVGPAVAFAFLMARKRRARAERRSPLTQDLLRGPGHALRERLEERRLDIMAEVLALAVLPLLLLCLYLVQTYLLDRKASLTVDILYVVFGLGLIAFLVWRSVKKAGELDTVRKGLDAEIAVGQELDQLMRNGAAVFHDMPTDKFNIDHVVIAPQGVFAIETKGYSKPHGNGGAADATVMFDGRALVFAGWSSSKPIDQAERQAQWLGKWLGGATGEPVTVTPVLALPGWFVDRQGRGSVRVYSGRELAGLLKARGAQPLSSEQMQRVVHQVEQRCRNVKPTYRPEETAG
jgi:hypothetical protein